MNQQQALGFIAMAETIESGGDIHKQMSDFANHEGIDSDVFTGALSCLCDVAVSVRNAGIRIENDNPLGTSFINSSRVKMQIEARREVAYVGMLADVALALRPCLRFKAAAAPVQKVIDVRVTSMPERIRSTEVERDNRGNIATARQIERDYA